MKKKEQMQTAVNVPFSFLFLLGGFDRVRALLVPPKNILILQQEKPNLVAHF